MTPERFQQVIALFQNAAERPAADRAAFIEQACAGDEELRREVESLLHQEASREGPLDRPVWFAPKDITTGTQLGSYVIETQLGEGGMGVVYRARDTKLNRTVAVKFLSDELADAAARRRFQREAQLASSLNHPHILTVHDAGEFDGRQYLVTEFIDGGTLRDWARRTPPGWQQVVEMLTGVADGLACAHEAGMLHRDIKPENILVTKSGYAKLADFGLAKLLEIPQGDVTRTLTQVGTRPGVILGTIAYMSPEQASGKSVDAPSDVFSFGIVLYELLAGKRPFQGATDLETLQRVIHGAPEPLPADIPVQLCGIVEKALEKDPANRYQSMRDLVVDLRRILRSSGEKPATRPRYWRPSMYRIAAAMLLLAGGLAMWRFFPRNSGASEIRSIAVLPLENLSGDPSQEYFSAGITEALISNLAQIRSLKVISRTSAMRYKGTNKPLSEIGRELGVDAILEGSVQRAGTRVRISAQLIRAATDSHLWAQDYERDIVDVLGLEGEVARSIASRIRIELTPDETRRLTGRRINPEAQEAYLRGRYHTWNMNDHDQLASISDFEEAIRLQPNFAAAYAGMAFAWITRFDLGFVPSQQAERPAREAAAKAIQLDPKLSDAYVTLADLSWFDWDWKAGERAYQRAIELDPNFVDARNDYSYFLIVQGRLPEAIAQIERAAALDPLNPGVRVTFGLALARSRRYTEAEQHYNRVLELDPRNPIALRNLTSIAEQTGDLERALNLIEQQVRDHGGDMMEMPQTGRIYAKQGRHAEALRVLAKVTEPGSQANAMQVASLYLSLGDKDRCFEWLTKAFENRASVLLLKTDPLFESVHSDPRFQALLRRLGVAD